MLLAVDIGNSNIKFGIHDDDLWAHFWPVETVRDRMPDEYAVQLRSFFNEAGLAPHSIDRAIISSVVPQLTQGIVGMIARQTGREPILLSPGTNTGIAIKTDKPETVGSDLIANAIAGYERFKTNCIIVNFGTATTLTAVAEPGEFRGVSIAAGLAVTANALVGGAAQLAHVELISPPSVIGRNTRHSMQSGLVLGHIAMIEGLIDRMRAELGGAKVIATGGLAPVLASLTDYFDDIDLMLTLEGLRIVAGRNT